MDYEAIARSYHQNGFEIVARLFSAQELKEIGLELQHYLEEEISAPDPGEVYYEDVDIGARPVRCVFRMHQRSNYFRQLRGCGSRAGKHFDPQHCPDETMGGRR